jgi:adenine-specific DNA-methyltransferase
MPRGRRRTPVAPPRPENYQHTEATQPLRPEVGTQPLFKKKKEPATYRYDSSLSPALDWDNNPAREQGEALLQEGRSQNSEVRRLLAALKAIKLTGLAEPYAIKLTETIAAMEAALAGGQAALEQLRALSKPFLNWTGKAERLSFDVPTLPLFVHERLSTRAILETLKAHKRDKQEDFVTELFGNASLPVTDQILRAYEHREKWQNRMVLGDSLVVMNSLLRFENLGGQVQMIYVDPPYGVKFGSNFQPFVRKRDVTHGDDADLTREPEMVQAYRDTWELGLHSYLTYLRDRLLLAKELLHPSGSIFVQISDENLHHVRELMDEVFGVDNRVSVITFRKTSGAGSISGGTTTLAFVADYLLWYAKDISRVKYNQLYLDKEFGEEGASQYQWLELADGTRRRMTVDEKGDPSLWPVGSRPFGSDNLTSASGVDTTRYPVEFSGRTYRPHPSVWKTSAEGMEKLKAANRLIASGDGLYYVRYLSDFPCRPLANLWDDTISSFMADKLYVVQTNAKVIQRCLLMTTDPGDLVLDPTCGSGTTAYVAEQWGRRWITMDTSRVPLALARQRLLTATFDFYEINTLGRVTSRGAGSGQPADATTGNAASGDAAYNLPNNPAAGFVYRRKQNNKGEEVGGIVPHVTLKSIANNEPPAEEVLVDRPEIKSGIVRVCGPFTVEATIPTPVEVGEKDESAFAEATADEHGNFVNRMIEVLRRNPVLRLGGNRSVTLRQVRPPARTLSLHAEALVKQPTLESIAEDAEAQKRLMGADEKPVAFVFGPENGAVSGKLVENAAMEARRKDYTHLYVIGFAIEAGARKAIEESEAAFGIPATYVQATPDILMGDLLKTMRSSQIFSVCGLPEIKVGRAVPSAPSAKDKDPLYQVELLGLDVFDPVEMKSEHRSGMDVPAWFLDTDYNGTVFRVCQAFFPRTGAWENLKRELRAEFEESVWAHLAGTASAPFPAGSNKTIAVKVIDDRGNELLVTKELP